MLGFHEPGRAARFSPLVPFEPLSGGSTGSGAGSSMTTSKWSFAASPLIGLTFNDSLDCTLPPTSFAGEELFSQSVRCGVLGDFALRTLLTTRSLVGADCVGLSSPLVGLPGASSIVGELGLLVLRATGPDIVPSASALADIAILTKAAAATNQLCKVCRLSPRRTGCGSSCPLLPLPPPTRGSGWGQPLPSPARWARPRA
mmetsp:Transcript_99279/g.256715  ORF Transcript_99279/g.256715 Transcript_99279/m.256715 type:complete len:201 (+) Transcript_99279:1469-2071(+)